MVVLQRVLLPIINAFFITSVLFYCMFLLIDIEHPTLKTKATLPKLQWVDIPDEVPITGPIIKPKPPAKIEEQPEVPKELIPFKTEIDGLGGTPIYKPVKPTDITVASNSQLTLMLGEAEPAGVFDKSALKAITRFKYKPHRVDGKAVSADGQQYLFRYEMGENKKS